MLDGFWGLGEVNFEVDPGLVKWYFFMPFADVAGEYLCICDFYEDHVNELVWSFGISGQFSHGCVIFDGSKNYGQWFLVVARYGFDIRFIFVKAV